MQEHGRRKPPPLVFIKYRVPMARDQTVYRFPAHSPEDSKTAAPCFAGEGHPADAKHQNVRDQQRRCYGSFLLAKESGKSLTQGSQRKSQASAALVAACGSDSD